MPVLLTSPLLFRATFVFLCLSGSLLFAQPVPKPPTPVNQLPAIDEFLFHPETERLDPHPGLSSLDEQELIVRPLPLAAVVPSPYFRSDHFSREFAREYVRDQIRKTGFRSPDGRPLELRVISVLEPAGLIMILTRPATPEREKIWSTFFRFNCGWLEPQRYLELIAGIGSETGLAEALRKTGDTNEPASSPKPRAKRDFHPPVEETDFNVLGQFALARYWEHERIAHPEDPSVVLPLARAYARLAILTEDYLSHHSSIFRARGLLLASRAVGNDPSSVHAGATLAYTMSLSGFPGVAEYQVNRVRNLPETDDIPAWLDPIDAFSLGDAARLQTLIEIEDEQSKLAVFLQMLLRRGTRLPEYLSEAVLAVLEEQPDCFAALHLLAGTDQLGYLRGAMQASRSLLPLTLADRFETIPEVPSRVKAVLAEEYDELTSFEKEVQSRVKLQAALRNELDNNSVPELPLAVLAELLDELTFLQVERQLKIEGGNLCVSVAGTWTTYAPLVGKHPMAGALGRYFHQPSDQNLRPSLAATTTYIETHGHLLGDAHLRGLFGLTIDKVSKGPLQIPEAVEATEPSLNRVAIDLYVASGRSLSAWSITLADAYALHEQSNFGFPPVIPQPLIAAPKWPMANALQFHWQMKYIRDFSVERAEKLMRSNLDNPDAQSMVAEFFKSHGKPELREEALRNLVNKAPSMEAYRELATFYKGLATLRKGKDREKWKATLDEALERVPDSGLDHSRVQVEIANYLMFNKQYEEALPYAEAAAESYAEWALMCAFRCHALLHNWEKAELYLIARAGRYNAVRDYFSWVIKSGHGDLESVGHAALADSVNVDDEKRNKIAEPYKLRTLYPAWKMRGQGEAIAAWCVIVDRNEDALTWFDALLIERDGLHPDGLACELGRIVVAHRMKETALRDKHLETFRNWSLQANSSEENKQKDSSKTVSLTPEQRKNLLAERKILADLLAAYFRTGVWNAGAWKSAVTKLRPGTVTTMHGAVGSLLWWAGDQRQATAYLEQGVVESTTLSPLSRIAEHYVHESEQAADQAGPAF